MFTILLEKDRKMFAASPIPSSSFDFLDASLLTLEQEELNMSVLQRQIKACYKDWCLAGKPKTLDTFFPELLLGLDNNEALIYSKYAMIGRKILLSIVRRAFSQSDDIPINHFLVFVDNGYECSENFCMDLVLSMFRNAELVTPNLLHDIGLYHAENVAFFADIENILQMTDNQISKAVQDKLFVMDSCFTAEYLNGHPAKYMKRLLKFICKSKDHQKRATKLQMQQVHRAFYFIGATWEKNFIETFKDAVISSQLKETPIPLLVDLTKDCRFERAKIGPHKLLNTSNMTKKVRHIFGEAYARVVLGQDIPASSYVSFKGDLIDFADVLVSVGGTKVENWNITKNENPTDLPLLDVANFWQV